MKCWNAYCDIIHVSQCCTRDRLLVDQHCTSSSDLARRFARTLYSWGQRDLTESSGSGLRESATYIDRYFDWLSDWDLPSVSRNCYNFCYDNWVTDQVTHWINPTQSHGWKLRISATHIDWLMNWFTEWFFSNIAAEPLELVYILEVHISIPCNETQYLNWLFMIALNPSETNAS
jgi:hypothetical protein